MDHLSEEDVVVVAEGDGTNDSSLLPAMLHKIASGADLVGASRFLSGGGYENFPFLRHSLSLVANWTYRTFFPIPNFSDLHHLLSGIPGGSPAAGLGRAQGKAL